MSFPFERSSMQQAIATIDGTDGTNSSNTEIPLYRNTVISLGRCAINNDKRVKEYVFKDIKVSSIHCYIWSIQFDENTPAVCYLKDVSTNHTYVNSEPVKNNEYVILNDQDEIEIIGGFKGTFLLKKEQQQLETDLSKELATKVGYWTVLPKVLGTGSFGKVQVAYKGNNKKRLYAVKVIKMTVLNGRSEMETSILTRIKHPNVICIYESAVDKALKSVRIFQDLAIGGDLFSYLSRNQEYLSAVSESETIVIVYQIAIALDYLHRKGVVHRDLKLDNILIMDVPVTAPRIVLADFGVAKQNKPLSMSQIPNFAHSSLNELREEFKASVVDAEVKTRKGRAPYYWMSTVVGTAEYAAPEIDLLDKRKSQLYNEKVDSWSLGVITYILLTGQSPFYANALKATIDKVRRGLGGLNNSRWHGISHSAKAFVRGCLNGDINNRWDIRQCLQSEFFTTGDRAAILKTFMHRPRSLDKSHPASKNHPFCP